MMKTAPLSEVDILEEIIAPNQGGWSPETARSMLELKFGEKTRRRIRRLLQKNNRGTIAAGERVALEKYLRVGQFLDLLQAKARLSLQQSGNSL